VTRYTVYGLVDPRKPEDVRYVGRTGVGIEARVNNHIAQTRFRVRHDIPLCYVMEWVDHLLSQGVRPIGRVIATNLSLTRAVELENDLINASDGTLLNDPNHGATTSGKKVGQLDSEEGRRNKVTATKDLAARARHLLEVATARRAAKGYPHPELPMNHPLNWEHTRKLTRKTPRRATPAGRAGISAALLRHHAEKRKHLPRPDLAVNHPLNIEAYKAGRHSALA